MVDGGAHLATSARLQCGAVSQRECNFKLFLAKAKEVLEKGKQGAGASMRRSLLTSKTKTVKSPVMYLLSHPKEGSFACKENTLRVRERGACPALQEESVSEGNALKESRVDILDKEKLKVRNAEKPRGCVKRRGGEKRGQRRDRESEERDRASGVCAKAYLATVYAHHQNGKLLKR
eukprot:6209592-Pleurochrysis_carterae.AAC.1